MKRIYWLSILVVLVVACQDDQVLKEDNGLNTDQAGIRMLSELSCGDAESYPLMVNTTQVGTVTVTVSETGFNVHYDLSAGEWFLLDAKAFAGSCSEIPTTTFPYEQEFFQDDEVRDFSFDIPWEALPDCGCIYATATVAKYNSSSALVTSATSIRTTYCKCGPPPPPVACHEILNIPIGAEGNAAVEVTEAGLSITYDVTTSEWFLLELYIQAGDCADLPNGLIIERLYAQDDEVRVDNVPIAAESLPLCGCFHSLLTIARYNANSQLETRVITIDANYCLCEEEEEPGDLRTQTQGGWGAEPNGNNPGVYLHANFSGAFPGGLIVGCTYTLKFTTAQAITNFLPQGGQPKALNVSYVNPPNIKNVFAGQVVALKLNTTFDAYDEDFSESDADLGTAHVVAGPFAGWTVYQVLAEAEKALGGCASQYTYSQLNEAATLINESWDNGVMQNDYISF